MNTDPTVTDWSLRGLWLAAVALVSWVWRVERRVTQSETVLYGVANSSSVVQTLSTVTNRLDEQGRLLAAVAESLKRIQKEHDDARRLG